MNDAEHGLTVQLRTNGHLNGEWRYATPEEIKDAHPVCRDCQHRDQHLVMYGSKTYYSCNNDESPCYGNEVKLSDYCRHWEGKE